MADKQPGTGLAVALTQEGLLRKDVAKKLGVEAHTVSNWATGKTMPSKENQILLAELLGRTIDELFFSGCINHKPDTLKEITI